jgi:filamentous hemagglutinin
MQLGAGGGGGGFTASASKATGQGAGNSTTYTNSQVAGNTVNIESGGDTNLKGAVVKADQVTAKVGGNLNIESLQDKSQYKESSKSAGGSVMVGAGYSGSVNLAKSSINSDYLSVGEQSAIRAGDGGFQVNVQGKTTLTGGQITSTQAAIDNNKNSYEAKQGTTTTDLQNSANYSANSVGVGIGAGTLPGKSASAGMSGVGLGSDKGSAQSTTTAGISGVAGNAAARTGDKSTSINPIFDKDKTQKEVAAQVAITSEFGKQASKAVGDYAGNQLKDLSRKANAETDPGKKAALQAEAAKWEEGGAYRVAMHTAVGGLTGGLAGAVGAGAASAAAPTIDQLQGQLKTAIKNAGLGDSAANVISSLAGGTTAAAIGAAASGGSVAGGATAFNSDMNNRQLRRWL